MADSPKYSLNPEKGVESSRRGIHNTQPVAWNPEKGVESFIGTLKRKSRVLRIPRNPEKGVESISISFLVVLLGVNPEKGVERKF